MIEQPFIQSFAAAALGSQLAWLVILGGFVVVSFIAKGLASGCESKGALYVGLGI